MLARHGLHDWAFAFNRRKRALGLCRYDAKAIELSIFFIDRNGVAEVRNPLLHEIAHALVGSGPGHDAVWKAKAAAVGARPRRCGQADMPSGGGGLSMAVGDRRSHATASPGG